MKKQLLLVVFSFLFVTLGFSQEKENTKKQKQNTETKNDAKPSTDVVVVNPKPTKEVLELRKKHEQHLENNPFKKTFLMSKRERKSEGIPPNKYNEQEWILSMNPALGSPTPENLEVIRQRLSQERQAMLAAGRTPGDATDNLWVERGPNNVGGRTKGIIFDPTDATFNTVIAGGVSGGLWKNTNITSSATVWTRISTFPEHINVQNITVDPNNSSTWYVGTGESYTGDANGNGIWKTTNAGLSWTRVFGGGTVSSTQSQLFNLYITAPSNAGVIRGYSTGLAGFGAPPASFGSNKSIVLVNDGVAPTDDACSSLTAGSLNNKIALIRRGTCTFESKVLAAEIAGAVGVIIMNNVAGAGPVGMASSDLGATIPCVSVSKEDGDLLVANLTNLTGDFAAALPGQFSGTGVTGFQFINDIAIKNVGGVSHIYAAVGDSYNAGYHNSANYGMYKSTDGGATWTALTLPLAPSGNKTCPMDIEIAVGGKIWVSSTDSSTFGDGGGKIFVSNDEGATFTTAYTVSGGQRTEIEASNTTADVIYVLSQITPVSPSNIEVQMLKTTNGFSTAPTVLTLPTDASDSRIGTYGFTGAQAFYNLFIETDPTNDAKVFIGGLNVYRSTNSGAAWTAISRWNSGNLVHSDQHAMVFKPNNPDVAVVGNDGGIYYNAALSTATTTTTFASRNNGFNVTQFVGVAVQPLGVTGLSGDFFVAGAQDNGSNYFPSTLSTTTGAAAGISGSSEVQGGDGGIPLFKQNPTSSSTAYYVTNYVYNDNMVKRGLSGASQKVLSDGTSSRGLFYPAMTLDSSNDIVYSDFTDGTNRVYAVRRYASYMGGPAPARTDLTNALLTSYPTALNTGKVTKTTLYIGTANSKLLKVTGANNTAGTWSDISATASFVGTISDIEFGADDSQIFVTLKNYGTTNIWYTNNGGTNWYNIEGDLPDMPVHAILQNPLNSAELMIGTDLGVWYANTFNPATNANQSLAWKSSFNGMMNVKVTDLDLQPNSPTAPTAYNVFAATYGRGVFSGALTSVTLSNEDVALLKGINIYPNPAKSTINIGIANFTGDLNIEIYDINGRLALTTDVDFSGTKSLNIGDLQSGIYILKLKGQDLSYFQKIIVN